jgi:hypothetical protein
VDGSTYLDVCRRDVLQIVFIVVWYFSWVCDDGKQVAVKRNAAKGCERDEVELPMRRTCKQRENL